MKNNLYKEIKESIIDLTFCFIKVIIPLFILMGVFSYTIYLIINISIWFTFLLFFEVLIIAIISDIIGKRSMIKI